jgi:hypothetical protein
MKLRRITTRAAVAAVSTALATGALVGAGTGAANAADAEGSYNCSVAGTSLGAFTFDLSVPLLPPTAVAGMPIGDGLLGYTSALNIPLPVAQQLSTYGITGGHADDFAMQMGSTSILAPATYALGTPTATALPFQGTGGNSAFALPAAGTYDILLPKTFSVIPTVGGLDFPFPMTCVTDAPAKLGSVALSKQTSTTTGKATKTTKGYKLVSTVKNQFSTATGKVVAKLGTKSWTSTLKSGKATFNLPKTAKGKKVALSYKGDSYTAPSKGAVKVK